METTDKRRRDFVRLDSGWLRDTADERLGKMLLCWGTMIFIVMAVVAQGIRQAGPLLGLSGCLSVLAIITGGFLLCKTKALQGDVQYCPNCLQSMTAGAVICPYCGRKGEQPSCSPV